MARTIRVIATSFALLFLSKGRRPVLLAKLSHGPGEDWNQHRNDVANLTIYVEIALAARPDLAGDRPGAGLGRRPACRRRSSIFAATRARCPATRSSSRQLAQKLRDYLDRGGFLFAEGYCGGDGFRPRLPRADGAGFRHEPEYRLKLLDPSHPIWHAEEKVPPEQLRPLLGIDFGCRTSVVYAPPDPPAGPAAVVVLPVGAVAERPRAAVHPQVQAQIDAARAIGINVLAYATNREVKSKEEDFGAAAAAPPPRSTSLPSGERFPSPSSAIPAAATRRRGPWST